MQSIIQIIKVNEVKSGISKETGRAYEIQDAECILLEDTGAAREVGVLPIPKALRGDVKTGVYIGTFALRADLRSRRIEAVLTGLQSYAIKQGAPAAPKVA